MNITLDQAKQNVSAFIGKHGIHTVRGNDRVVVYSAKALSNQAMTVIVNAAAPFRVEFMDGEVAVIEDKVEKTLDSVVAPVKVQEQVVPTVQINSVGQAVSAIRTINQVNDINAKGKWGYTLLHVAAMNGDEAECDRLIGLGANRKVKDNSKNMPWQKALTAGHAALAEKLKPAGYVQRESVSSAIEEMQ